MWQTMSARTCGSLRQKGHVAQSYKDKCQVDLAFQEPGNHNFEGHVADTDHDTSLSDVIPGI
jgi:hypothetical protein